jgi:glutamate synthase domain-containing protein 3
VAEIVEINANGTHYKHLNELIGEKSRNGAKNIILRNVHGQRYIGTNVHSGTAIDIYGTPGNDLGAFMDGAQITVYGNAQDGCGNTMNNGRIVIHGHCGDIAGFSMRGGKIFVKEDAGYRAGIHMKEYGQKKPLLVIGGTAQDFLGEYMAGGIVILLGLTLKESKAHRLNFIGTGMHGGGIYIRGDVNAYQFGKEVGAVQPQQADIEILKDAITEFAGLFNYDPAEILSGKFTKLYPKSLRPYGKIYAY